MLLMCDQCGNQDSRMLKIPSSLVELDANNQVIVFDNSSTETYINLCTTCIGFFEK